MFNLKKLPLAFLPVMLTLSLWLLFLLSKDFSQEVKVATYKIYYSFFPIQLETKLANEAVDFTQTHNQDLLSFWLKVGSIQKNIDAFSQTEKFSKSSCHINAHLLGQASYETFKDEAFSYYSAWCGSGYIHGVMEAFLKTNGYSDSVIKNICSSFNDKIKSGDCIHGVGHGFLSYEDYNLPKALDSCKKLASTSLMLSACYDGVFMENLMANEGVGKSPHPTKWVSSDPLFPCNALEDSEVLQNACITQQINRILSLSKNNLDSVSKICSTLNNSKKSCFYGLGLNIPQVLKTVDAQKLVEACNFGKQEQNWCISGELKFLVKYFGQNIKNEPHQLCTQLKSTEEKRECYKNLGRHLSLQSFDSPSKFKEICFNSEHGYAETCLNGAY